MTKRKSTIDERLSAVKEYTEAGKPYEQIARERGFSYRQVYEWVRKYRKLGIAGLEDRRGERKISQTPRSKEEELEKRIAELEHENHLLKLEWAVRSYSHLHGRQSWFRSGSLPLLVGVSFCLL